MGEIDIITAVVVAQLTRGLGDLAAAPLRGVAGDLERRVKDAMGRIGRNATEKADGKPVEAPDRVLHKALLEGAFADDEVVADYIGGVLAASDHSDDASPIIALIGRLSSAQLRLHFLVYRELRRLMLGTQTNIGSGEGRSAATMLFEADELGAAIGMTWVGLGSALAVLSREGLLQTYSLTFATKLATVVPVNLGAELFLWGNGLHLPPVALFDPAIRVRYTTDVPSTPSARLQRAAAVETSGGKPSAR
jgi:hypothetical protein